MSKSLVGTIVKKGSAKTVTVAVTTIKTHPIYQKQYQLTRTLLAHDPSDAITVGQKVKLYQSRPISKRKHWLAIAQA